MAAPAVAAIASADLAGVINYCIEINLITHGNGDAVQTALNAKTHAVPPDYTNSCLLTPMCPVSQTEGHDAPGLVYELIPGVA
ncbi:hypothetical protein KOE73_16115, partial [Acidomonas methanolica]|nr:hypothetical protein [Acidomonas methanolica]